LKTQSSPSSSPSSSAPESSNRGTVRHHRRKSVKLLVSFFIGKEEDWVETHPPVAIIALPGFEHRVIAHPRGWKLRSSSSTLAVQGKSLSATRARKEESQPDLKKGKQKQYLQSGIREQQTIKAPSSPEASRSTIPSSTPSPPRPAKGQEGSVPHRQRSAPAGLSPSTSSPPRPAKEKGTPPLTADRHIPRLFKHRLTVPAAREIAGDQPQRRGTERASATISPHPGSKITKPNTRTICT